MLYKDIGEVNGMRNKEAEIRISGTNDTLYGGKGGGKNAIYTVYAHP